MCVCFEAIKKEENEEEEEEEEEELVPKAAAAAAIVHTTIRGGLSQRSRCAAQSCADGTSDVNGFPDSCGNNEMHAGGTGPWLDDCVCMCVCVCVRVVKRMWSPSLLFQMTGYVC